jgi:hypothetical protein
MKAPEIIIDGKVYTAKSPKASYWRKMVLFDERQKDIPDKDYLFAHAELIAEVFDDPFVTGESVLENLNVDDVRPKYLEVVKWIFSLVNSKLGKLPNQEPPKQ